MPVDDTYLKGKDKRICNDYGWHSCGKTTQEEV
jgi:hypothetical protein